MPKLPETTGFLELSDDEFHRRCLELSINQLVDVAISGLRTYQFLSDDGQSDQEKHTRWIFFELLRFYYFGQPDSRPNWHRTCNFALEAIKNPHLKLMLELAFDLTVSHYGQPASDAVGHEKIDIFKKIMELLKESEIILVDLRPLPLNWAQAIRSRLFGQHHHFDWGGTLSKSPIFSFSFAGLSAAAEKTGRLSIRGRAAVALRGLEIYLARNTTSEAERVSNILPLLWADLAAKKTFEYSWGEPYAVVDELDIEYTALGKMFICALDTIGVHFYTVVSEDTERSSKESLKTVLFLLQKNGIFLKNIDGALKLTPVPPRFVPLGESTWGRPLDRDRIAPLIEYETV